MRAELRRRMCRPGVGDSLSRPHLLCAVSQVVAGKDSGSKRNPFGVCRRVRRRVRAHACRVCVQTVLTSGGELAQG